MIMILRLIENHVEKLKSCVIQNQKNLKAVLFRFRKLKSCVIQNQENRTHKKKSLEEGIQHREKFKKDVGRVEKAKKKKKTKK